MREIRTSDSMSGEGKRSNCHRLKPPRPSSTLPLPRVYDAVALFRRTGITRPTPSLPSHVGDRQLHEKREQ